MTLLQLQVLIGDHFLTSFQPTCLHYYFTFLLINDVRMTTFTHQALSRKTSSLTMRVRIFQPQCYGARRCVAHRLGRSRLHSTMRATMWLGAWQLARLATRHQGEMWPLVTTAGRCSLLHCQKHSNLQLVNCSLLSQTFCPPNSPDLDTVNLPSGVCSSADGLHHQNFSLVNKMKRAIVKSMTETTACRSHCQFIIFYRLFIYG